MERRKHERARVSINIDWGTTPYCLWQDRITSLSVGGCFLQTARELIAGEKLYVRFWLATGAEQVLRGEVRYCMERVGLGVEFLGLMEREKDQLAELIEHYREAAQGGPAGAGGAP